MCVLYVHHEQYGLTEASFASDKSRIFGSKPLTGGLRRLIQTAGDFSYAVHWAPTLEDDVTLDDQQIVSGMA